MKKRVLSGYFVQHLSAPIITRLYQTFRSVFIVSLADNNKVESCKGVCGKHTIISVKKIIYKYFCYTEDKPVFTKNTEKREFSELADEKIS